MTDSSTWITPGSWTAIAGASCWVLTDTKNRTPGVRELWSAVSSTDVSADDILNLLVTNGLGDLPGFAVVHAAGDTVRMIVRHPAAVRLDSGTTSEEIAPAPGITWVDTIRARPSELRLTSSNDSTATNELPLTLGASAADALFVAFDGTAPIAPTVDVPDEPMDTMIEADVVPDDLPEPVPEPSEVDPEPAVPAAEPPASHVAAPVSNPYLGLLLSSTGDRDALLARLNETDNPAPPQGAAEPPASKATAHWQHDPDDPGIPAAPEGDGDAPAPTRTPTTGLIDGVPGMGGSPSTAPPKPAAHAPAGVAPEPLVTAEPADEASNMTMTRGRFEQLLGAGASFGPTVHAVRCRQGHLSNPILPLCRVCSEEMPEQNPVEVPRPALGVLTMPNGDTVPVDKTIVLGRAPQPTPGSDEHLVTVTTSAEISRMHARLTVDGWNVVLRDLNTTNGTFLKVPGEELVQLRAGEDYLVEPGSEIDLADTLTLRFEAR